MLRRKIVRYSADKAECIQRALVQSGIKSSGPEMSPFIGCRVSFIVDSHRYEGTLHYLTQRLLAINDANAYEGSGRQVFTGYGLDLGRLFFDRRRVVELRLILLTNELDGEVILEPVEEPVSTLEPIKPSATVAESCRTGITSRQRVSGRIAIFLVGCLTTWALMNAEHIHALIERFFDRTERTVVGLLTGR